MSGRGKGGKGLGKAGFGKPGQKDKAPPELRELRRQLREVSEQEENLFEALRLADLETRGLLAENATYTDDPEMKELQKQQSNLNRKFKRALKGRDPNSYNYGSSGSNSSGSSSPSSSSENNTPLQRRVPHGKIAPPGGKKPARASPSSSENNTPLKRRVPHSKIALPSGKKPARASPSRKRARSPSGSSSSSSSGSRSSSSSGSRSSSSSGSRSSSSTSLSGSFRGR